MIQDNIYIKTMEYGFNAGEVGISYNEVIQRLRDDGHLTTEVITLSSFQQWFFMNFHSIYITQTGKPPLSYPDKAKEKPAMMTGEATMKYIEYLEYTHARDDAKEAKRQALVALRVAIALGALQVIAAIAAMLV